MAQQRMILRRMGADASTSADVAGRLKDAPNIVVLQHLDPSTLLVEGHPEAIAGIVSGLSGWNALPITTYPIPDARPGILKPSAE
jgi:hypothetical protein